jgi:glycosyltransferase involved in cell wall biosynthesis
MRLGIIARSDNTGLGNQTKELVDMLNPFKILLIDSSHFNKNKQHPEWYSGHNVTTTKHGMASKEEVSDFLNDLDVVISCEIFYNNSFIAMAKKRKVKTILQYNYEFLDNLANLDLALPDILVAPSLWNFEHIVTMFGDKTKVVHIPPPTNVNLFSNAKNINTSKIHKKILHVGGKAAVKDRNGTNTVIEMLKYSKTDYELVVKSQTLLDIKCNDPRLTLDTSSPDTRESLYEGYDAMVMPRRYGGLCLPMNEALLSSLPVFMTNISPNNNILPKKWLTDSIKIDNLMTRTMLDVYEGNAGMLANLIDDYYNSDTFIAKNKAFELGVNNFSQERLYETYQNLLKF